MFSLLKPFRKHIILGPFFKLLEAVFELLLPLFMARLIDFGVTPGDHGYILRTGALMLGTVVLGMASSATCQYFASLAAQGYGTALRDGLFHKIQRLSMRQLDALSPSALITRITSDINAVQLGLAMSIRLLLRVPFIAVCAIVMMMVIDPTLYPVLLVSVPVIGLILWLLMRKSLSLYKEVQLRLEALTRIVRENLAGVRVIRAFAREAHEVKRYQSANRQHAHTSIRVNLFSTLSSPLTTLMMNLAILAVLYLGGIRIDGGRLTQGELIALINYLVQITMALVVFTSLAPTLSRGVASFGRVRQVMELEPDMQNGAQPMPEDGEYAIQFDDVSFAYGDASERALENISFGIRPGQVLGVIGGTGSGKSTLAALLVRLYDPTSGHVRVMGRDVKEVRLDELRRTVALAPQVPQLISGTIFENIAFGRQVSEAQVIQAAHHAQALPFIERMPGSLQAWVEQGGVNLSGGQKQRISVARALVAWPEILVLDDTTSALDTVTDAALRKAIRHCAPTRVIVAQRVSSVQDSDKILVLEEGRMAGFDSHEALLQTCDAYRQIVSSQGEAQP